MLFIIFLYKTFLAYELLMGDCQCYGLPNLDQIQVKSACNTLQEFFNNDNNHNNGG